MHESVIERARVLFLILEKLLCDVKSHTNKDRERLVPAAAVIPAVQVATIFIGSKTSVACLVSLL
jgi:hypothetical protein